MKKILILATIVAPLVLWSCGDDDDDKTSKTNENVNANIVGTDPTVARYEMPHLNSRYDYIVHTTSDGTLNYAMEYDKQNLQPRWVAYTYDGRTAQKNISSRTDAWAVEPFYNKEPRYQVAVQTFTGFNRGHIIGSAERYYMREANEQTFYMSNMSPMLGAFNSTYWGSIEDMVRDDWGRAVLNKKSAFYEGTLYVVKGGCYEADTPRAVQVYVMSGDRINMAIPDYFWIACLYVDKTGSAKAIGFWLEHKDYKNESQTFLAQLRQSAACSIDELEKRTGIDFFCNLPDNAENIVEATCNLSAWPAKSK